jgi:nitrite reductase/ring-hydroxylating ferredoxin subunit
MNDSARVDAPLTEPLHGGPPPRRDFLGAAASVAMGGGLLASYGTFAWMAGRFIFPARGTPKAWLFVCESRRLAKDQALTFRAPSGLPLVIARRAEAEAAQSFIALSSTCPHLGCQVHWEPQNDRFFCPCHNGAFDRLGKATEGPPAKAGQSLIQYPIKLEEGRLFVELPLEGLSAAPRRSGGGAPEVV